MPISLPPLPRRRFLAGALASASGFFLRSRVSALAAEGPTTTWALFSDTHVAADMSTVSRKVNMADNLKRAVTEVLALPNRPQAMVLSGDCVFLKGLPEDYETFKGLIKPLREAGLTSHLMLGNHDHRDNFHSAFQGDAIAASPVDTRHCGIVQSELANWFLLDSLDETNKTPGVLGDSQRQWLADVLDKHTDKPALIMVHHNVVTDPKKNALSLVDSDKLLEVVRPRKQVKAVFFGHTHVWEAKPDESGIHLINLPACAYVFKDVQPNGWVHATLSASGIKLKLNAFDSAHPLSGEVKDLAWRS